MGLGDKENLHYNPPTSGSFKNYSAMKNIFLKKKTFPFVFLFH